MGNLVWHQYAHFLTITASVYAIWAAYWGIFYRKFFWDFVGGIIRAPGGLQPSKAALPFVAAIVKVPVIQIIAMILGTVILLIEWPLPQLKGTAIQRSFVLKVVLLLLQAFFTVLFYQGTNAALWSMISAGCYGRAMMKGETMEEAKNNRGRGGKA